MTPFGALRENDFSENNKNITPTWVLTSNTMLADYFAYVEKSKSLLGNAMMYFQKQNML